MKKHLFLFFIAFLVACYGAQAQQPSVPVLTHTPVSGYHDPLIPIEFLATATDPVNTIASVSIYVSTDNGATFNVYSMIPIGADVYKFTLPPLGAIEVQYYIKATNNFGYTVQSGSLTCPHTFLVGLSWPIVPTQSAHTIRFFKTGTFQSIVTFDGSPIANGDVIGAFYSTACGMRAAGRLTWNTAAVINSMIVYGSSSSTYKDGFDPGEIINFKIFRKQTGEIQDANYVAYPLPGTSAITFAQGTTTMIRELASYSSFARQEQRTSGNVQPLAASHLSGTLTDVSAATFPRSVYTQFNVAYDGAPLLNLTEDNFYVREWIFEPTTGLTDTFAVDKDDVFHLYQPTNSTSPYTLRYTPTQTTFDGKRRQVEVIITYNGEPLHLYGEYTPGTQPVLLRTDETLGLGNTAQLNNQPITIEVDALDYSPLYSTSKATLYHRLAGSTSAYSQIEMVKTSTTAGSPSRSRWRATITAAFVNTPGIQYYISATNVRQGTTVDYQTTTIPEFPNSPGHPYTIAVLPALPPSVTHTPVTTGDPLQSITFTVNATDAQGISSAAVFISTDDGLSYTMNAMTQVTGTNTYQFTLPPIGGTGTILKYYIRVTNSFGVSTEAASASSPYAIVVGVPWTVTPTATLMTLRFFRTGLPNPATVTFDGKPAADGDVIAVFYTDDNGKLKPAGKVTWSTTITINSMTVYGDASGGIKDGLAWGEEVSFKIYRKQTGEIQNADYIAYPYPPATPVVFIPGRTTNIKEVSGYAEQTIALTDSYSVWSTYLIPKSTAFADILAPVASQVQAVVDADGNSYIPGVGGALTNYATGYGYAAIMNTPSMLQMKGYRNTTIPTVNLRAAGSFIGTPYTTPQNIERVFPASDPSIFMVERFKQASDGSLIIEAYLPSLGLNELTDKNMQPGKAYRVTTEFDRTFTFPAFAGAYPNRQATTQTDDGIKPIPQQITAANRYMNLVIPAEAYRDIAAGTEIRVYNATGKLVGRSLARTKGAIIAVDGALLADDEPFTIRTLTAKTGEEKSLVVDNWKIGSSVYKNHELAMVGTAREFTRGLEYTALNVFPNPLSGEGTITFYNALDQKVLIDLIDMQGKNVQTIAEGHFVKGAHTVKVSKQGLPPGVYVIKKTAGSTFETQRIMIK